MTTETERQIQRCEELISEFESATADQTAVALSDGVIEDDEAALIQRLEQKVEGLRGQLAMLRERLEQEQSAPRPDIVTNVGEENIEQIGGIEAVGPAVVLDPEGLFTSITAHLNIDYELFQGSSRVAHGRFSGNGLIDLNLTRGEEYLLTMTGSATINDSNFIMNDTANGTSVEVSWTINPPAVDASTSDPAIVLRGRPTLRPTSHPLADGATEWSIVVSDITAPHRDTSQAGLYFSFSTNETSGYGGSLTAGPADAQTSTSVTTSSRAALSTTLRFTHQDP